MTDLDIITTKERGKRRPPEGTQSVPEEAGARGS
jgi:hypothetical protein